MRTTEVCELGFGTKRPRAARKCSSHGALHRPHATVITLAASAETFNDRAATDYGSGGQRPSRALARRGATAALYRQLGTVAQVTSFGEYSSAQGRGAPTGERRPRSFIASQAPARSGEGLFVPVGAVLGATSAGSGPNSAWLIDAVTARRSPSTKCPYTSFVAVIDPERDVDHYDDDAEAGCCAPAPHRLMSRGPFTVCEGCVFAIVRSGACILPRSTNSHY
jgi:hypothetical protein